MAKSPGNHRMVRPRMMYGDGSSNILEDDIVWGRHHGEKEHADRTQPSRPHDTPQKAVESPEMGAHVNAWTTPDQVEEIKFPVENVSDSSAWNELSNVGNSQMSRTQFLESSRRRSTSDIAGSGVPKNRIPSVSRATLVRSFSRKLQSHAEIKTPVEIFSRRFSLIPKTTSLSDQPASRVAEVNSNQYSENVTRNSNKHKSAGGRTPTTSNFDSRNQFNRSRKSKLDFRHISRRGSQSWSTSYYHCDIVDDNLLISASKLDSTLIRLFSNTRSNKENNNQQNPGTDLMPFLNYAQSDLISMDPVMWRVYPMDAAQRETLDRELPYIEESITPKDVMAQLYQNDILTHMDYNQLIRTEGQGDRAVNRLLVRTLQRRGDKAYPAFLEALQSLNYTHIWHRLSETERSLRNGMTTGRSDCQRSVEMGNISTLPPRLPITPFESRGVKEANEIVSPIGNVVSSAYQKSSINNHSQQTNQETDRSFTCDQGLLANQLSSFDGHVTFNYNQPIIDSEKLEKQLRDLLRELEAVQEVVTALKSAPSPTVSQTSGTEVEFTMPTQHFDTQDTSSRIRTQDMTLPDTLYRSELNEPPQRRTQKSGSCIVL